MTEPRKLVEMIPRCIKLDCWKLGSEGYGHPCGLRTTSRGWPLPGDGETEIGRWNANGGRLFIDLIADPEFGPYVQEAWLGVLVTDKALRGSFYEGKGPVGKLSPSHHMLAFYWPYSLMAEPKMSSYQDDRRLHVIIEDPSGDGHLGLQGIAKPKTTKPDDFMSPVFSVKNRYEEFFDQVVEARAQCLSSGE